MKKLLQTLAALVSALCLTLAALLLLTAWMTTGHYVRAAMAGPAQQAQQERIDAQAAALAQTWHMTGSALTEASHLAAQRHQENIAAWWAGLFTGESDASLPLYLSEEAERDLIAAIMADEGFAAHVDADMLRAVARDEVAYALDEAVCQAVLPLRRSVTDLALAVVDLALPLEMARPVLLVSAGLLLGLAAVCCLLLGRRCGAALLAAAMWMALVTVPVWLLNVPGMLAELNAQAAVTGAQALRALALPWYGAAALLAAAGWLISGRRKIHAAD